MFNEKTKIYNNCIQTKVYQKTYNSKGEIDRTYVDMNGEITDFYSKRSALALGALNNDTTINIIFCFENRTDIFQLFETWDKFIEYAYKIKRRQLIKNGISWDDLRWYYILFESDEEYDAAVKKYQDTIVLKSLSRTKNKIYDIARSNDWDYFVTFTFDPKKVNSNDYEVCAKKLSKWLSNIRKLCPDIKYIIIPEKHKSGAYHFHGLFAQCNKMNFLLSGKYTADNEPIYNIGTYKYGWTTATAVSDCDRAVGYICKYITKELCAVSKGHKRYWASKNLERPQEIDALEHGQFKNRYLSAIKNNSVKWTKTFDTSYGKVGIIESEKEHLK